ncbi:MAG: hypothetical protein ACK4V6_07880 [Microthrixaceae bacterium]
MSGRTMHRTVRALVVAGLVLGVAACSDDPPDASGPTTAVAQDHADHAETIEVGAVDFAFEDLPERIAAGTRLTLENRAPDELHELVAFRLADDEQRPVPELLQLPPAELGALLGAAPPRTVLLAAPGEEQIPAVGDGTLDEPGRYLIMCAVPTGVDPATYLAAASAADGEQPQVEGGPPHFVHGMAAELVVE